MPKIGINWHRDEDFSMAGRSIYVGFNGAALDYKSALVNMENGKSADINALEWDLKEKNYGMVDITELFN